MKTLALVAGALFTLAVCMTDEAEAQTKPQVLFKTSMGDFTVELEPERAPKTVANFLAYVRAGHYDGTIFHRVIKNFMVQGGGFAPDMRELPTKDPVANEADRALPNDRGTIAMARTSDPNSATAQFFVNVVTNNFLNHTAKTSQGWGYTAFGRVTDGLNILVRMSVVQTGERARMGDVPIEPIVVEKATIIRE